MPIIKKIRSVLGLDPVDAGRVEIPDKKGKVLLLGTGDSGKTTLRKALELGFHRGVPESNLEWREIIWNNTIGCMVKVLNAMKSSGIQLEDEALANAARLLIGIKNPGLSSPLTDVLAAIVALRDHKSVKKCMERSNEFQLDTSASFWFTNAERILVDEYVPLNEDVLRARCRTTGIHTTTVQIGTSEFDIIDTAGERVERKKWEHCSDGVDVLILVVDSSCYDEMLFEDEKVNRMTDALGQAESTLNSDHFSKSHVILLFTKMDRLREKLPKSPLEAYFPDYKGKSFEDAKAYFERRFTSLAKDSVFEYPKDFRKAPSRQGCVMHCSFFEGKNVAEMIGNQLLIFCRG